MEGRHGPPWGQLIWPCHFPSLADHGLQRHQGASDSKKKQFPTNSLSFSSQTYTTSLTKSTPEHGTTQWEALALLYCKLGPWRNLKFMGGLVQVAKLRPTSPDHVQNTQGDDTELGFGSVLLPTHKGLMSLEMSLRLRLVSIVSTRGNGWISNRVCVIFASLR